MTKQTWHLLYYQEIYLVRRMASATNWLWTQSIIMWLVEDIDQLRDRISCDLHCDDRCKHDDYGCQRVIERLKSVIMRGRFHGARVRTIVSLRQQ